VSSKEEESAIGFLRRLSNKLVEHPRYEHDPYIYNLRSTIEAFLLREVKLGIGAVLFARDGQHWSHGPMGSERVNILRAFYRRQDLQGWDPIAINPFRELKHEDVNWETAGARVTGDRNG